MSPSWASPLLVFSFVVCLIQLSMFVVSTSAAASGLPSPVSVISLHPSRVPFIPTSAVAPRPGLPRTSKHGRGTREDYSAPWDWRGSSISAAAAIVAAITAALTGSLIAYCLRRRALQHSTRPDHDTAALTGDPVEEDVVIATEHMPSVDPFSQQVRVVDVQSIITLQPWRAPTVREAPLLASNDRSACSGRSCDAV